MEMKINKVMNGFTVTIYGKTWKEHKTHVFNTWEQTLEFVTKNPVAYGEYDEIV
jgi:hypothetical protein